MYRELLDLFKEAINTNSVEDIELFAAEVLGEMVKEASNNLSQAEIGLGEGAKAGIVQGATMGALGGALQGKLLNAGPVPALAGAGIGALVGPLGGALYGGIHGAFMDEAERKAIKKGENYDPVATGHKVGLIGGAVTAPPYQIFTMPMGYFVGDRIGKKYQEQNKEAFYSNLLSEFEKVAVDLPADGLEALSSELLDELVKEAGFWQLRKEHGEAAGELDKEYFALEQQIEDRAKDRLGKFVSEHGRRPTSGELEGLKAEYMTDFWNVIDKVAPNHRALQERMLAEDPHFYSKNNAVDFGAGAGTFGALTGGTIGALNTVGNNYGRLPSSSTLKDITSLMAKGTLKGTAAGAALGLTGGALTGYLTGKRQDKEALKRLEDKSASETSTLEKEAFPKIMNPKQFVESLKTGVKSSQQATDNAVNAAGEAAQKSSKAAKSQANKARSGNFITNHPYLSTLAGAGVGAMVPGAVNAVQNVNAALTPPPQPPQQPQYTMVPVPTQQDRK